MIEEKNTVLNRYMEVHGAQSPLRRTKEVHGAKVTTRKKKTELITNIDHLNIII